MFFENNDVEFSLDLTESSLVNVKYINYDITDESLFFIRLHGFK